MEKLNYILHLQKFWQEKINLLEVDIHNCFVTFYLHSGPTENRKSRKYSGNRNKAFYRREHRIRTQIK
jgi:hypothetical protein